MAARAWPSSNSSVDDLLFRNDDVSLHLLVNRRAETLRIFDFRTGAFRSKHTYVLSTARREHISRVFAIVEREEISTWTRFGLAREGIIPGFYKRTDGYVLGCCVDEPPAHPASRKPCRCLVRGVSTPTQQPQDLAETTFEHAKAIAAQHVCDPTPLPFRLAEMTEAAVRRALTAATSTNVALSNFETFGRGGDRIHFAGFSHHAPTVWLSVEIQPCFGHALIEFLKAPNNEIERSVFRAALELTASQLYARQVVGMFAFSPANDARLASVFLASGFRRTGLLAKHLRSTDGRIDAFLWTRKHPIHDAP